jgi:hypothetical protein
MDDARALHNDEPSSNEIYTPPHACGAKGCLVAETFDTAKFKRCSGCSGPYYCSRECQLSDWKIRHKKVCKKQAEERNKTASVDRKMRRRMLKEETNRERKGKGGDEDEDSEEYDSEESDFESEGGGGVGGVEGETPQCAQS